MTDQADAGRTVGATAAQMGVTIRTLHHWDAIGLVCPTERTDAGYRLYTSADLARIHRVLIYRELGVPLDEIKTVLDAPATDATSSLRRQRDELRERAARLQQMADGMDRMIEARASGILLSAEEQIEIFGEHWQPNWTAEAHERWGDTAQWAQYAERAAQRTAEDWQQIAATVDALNTDLAAAYRAGVLPGSAEANTLAERHRASIDTYFDCPPAMHLCIARTYLTTPDHTTFYNTLAPGLTPWLSAIIHANAEATMH
ncbi:MerR family transcriptional regulator [Nocardia sp. CA-135398]|uniref:MerR family transcriptional regulator n=1 Tax=Nocardia sp. CA-135398 TaxID=3239977 RepID=UPI003D97B3E3